MEKGKDEDEVKDEGREDMTSQVREERIIKEFDLSAYKALYLREAHLSLATLRQNLVHLQNEPSDRAALRQAHRAAHTLKGMSATMRYETLTALARSLEASLSQADQASLPLPFERLDAFLGQCDEFEKGLNQLDAADRLATGASRP
jgi:two-component system chemotaxis sensor kinase CheA